MTRILLRAHKDPFTALSAERTYVTDAIGSNVGNLVFSHAAHRLLSRRGTKIISTAQLAEPKKSRLGRRQGFDHVVIPLANAFRNSFREKLDELSAFVEGLDADVPVTVLGVGAQGGLGGNLSRLDPLADAVTRFMRAVLDRAPSVGVRGEVTREYLGALGFGDEHVTVIGCPSMFLRGPELTVREPRAPLTAQSQVAVNVSPYVAEMGAIVEKNAERYPRLTYFAQDVHTLGMMLGAPYAGPGRRTTNPVSPEHRLYREGRMVFCLDPWTWFDELAQREISFGTRIHGNIAALLAGTPAVVLAHDSRTLELARYYEIPFRKISKVSEKLDPARLLENCDWGPLQSGHAARWATFEGFLHAHGLQHAFETGGAADRFDAKVAKVRWPDPVRPVPYEQRAARVDAGVRDRAEKILAAEAR